MNERLKKLRKELGLTMESFGHRIGVGKTTISMIETGKSSLTDRNISTICKEWHVNESWLREGSGDMFITLSRDEKIAEFIGSVQFEAEDSFKKRLISVLASLTSEQWKLLEDFAIKLSMESKAENASGEPPEEDLES